MNKFIPLCALFIFFAHTAFAQAKEEKITQGMETKTTVTTYQTVTKVVERRMTKEEFAEYRRQQKAKRQAYRDSMAVVRAAQANVRKRYADSMAVVRAAQAANGAKHLQRREKKVSKNEGVLNWQNSLYLNISGYNGGSDQRTVAPSIGVEYVGGKRFNNTLFIGFGTGLVFNTYRSNGHLYQWYGYSSYNLALGLKGVSFPLYANMKVYLSKTACQPYISLSTGFRFSGKKTFEFDTYDLFSYSTQQKYVNSNHSLRYGTTQYFITPGFGLDFRLKSGAALSVQAAFHTITAPIMLCPDVYSSHVNIDVKHKMRAGYHIQIGVTF